MLEAEAFESCEGGIQNAPDRNTPWAGSSHGGMVRLAAGRAEGDATLVAGSGVTWMFGRKPAGGRYGGDCGGPRYTNLTDRTWTVLGQVMATA